jgi:hypothetical protein
MYFLDTLRNKLEAQENDLLKRIKALEIKEFDVNRHNEDLKHQTELVRAEKLELEREKIIVHE